MGPNWPKMDLPKSILSQNLGLIIKIWDFSLVPCQSTQFKVTFKLVTALSYIWFDQEVILKLVFLNFEILLLNVKVRPPTVITGKL